ncbi:MAG: tyrosine-type recombinase/integrase [Anaerolineae bacterium]|nr:tyrosine-type recombinase/integrase [Anaerolineae bacterium]
MNLSSAFDDFLLAKQADGCRPKTLLWYRSLLAPFVAARADRPLASISVRECREYIVGLRSQTEKYVGAPQRPTLAGGFSDETVRGHVTALHSFWNFCAREYEIVSPMRNIRRPPAPQRRQPRAIAPADFVRLFNATRDDDAGIRDRALLVFFADTGCRLGGLVGLRVDRLSLGSKSAQVIEKGNKLRTLYFTRYTVALVSQWLAVRQSSSDRVFVSMATGAALTESGVHQLLKRLKTRAGVQGRVNPHSFRHRFALEYRLQGGDISTLALFLGNSIEVAFAYYSIFDDQELHELRERHDPMAALIESGEMR